MTKIEMVENNWPKMKCPNVKIRQNSIKKPHSTHTTTTNTNNKLLISTCSMQSHIFEIGDQNQQDPNKIPPLSKISETNEERTASSCHDQYN